MAINNLEKGKCSYLNKFVSYLFILKLGRLAETEILKNILKSDKWRLFHEIGLNASHVACCFAGEELMPPPSSLDANIKPTGF